MTTRERILVVIDVVGRFLVIPTLVSCVLFSSPANAANLHVVPYSEALRLMDDGKISSITIRGANIDYPTQEGSFKTTQPPTSALLGKALSKGVAVNALAFEEDTNSAAYVLLSWLPLLAWLVSLWLFVARPLYAIGEKLDRYLPLVGKPENQSRN